MKWLSAIAATCGAIAASLVAFAAPQPYFWVAFPLYVVSATLLVYINKTRQDYWMMSLFVYYFFIDSFGVYNWWPW